MPWVRVGFGALAILVGACSSSGASPAAAKGCERDTQCPTYACTCKDGVTISLHLCDTASSNCDAFPSVCDSCASHGGAAGGSKVSPPTEPPPGSSGGTDGGAGSESGAECDALQAMSGCYAPVHVPLGKEIVEGAHCEASGLHTCGDSCPGNPHTGTWCCPPDLECQLDPLALVPKCGATANLDGVTYLCVPKGVKRCGFTPAERKAAGLGEYADDLGCVQHGTTGLFYSCNTHGPQATVHCVASGGDDSTLTYDPLCPAQAASCTPTGP